METHLIVGLLLSGVIGLSLGLIGGGGSIITVPVLVYVIGIEAHEAVGMSLAVVGGTSLTATIMHYRHGTVALRTGLLFGGAGVIGAFAGAPLTHLFSPSGLMLIFAALMLAIAILMLRAKAANDSSSSEVRDRTSVSKAIAAGFGVGILTGFLGVGGGFLIVPALVMFAGLPVRTAIGTSLLVIFLNCVAGFAAHARYGSFDLRLTLAVTALAVGGALLGSFLSQRVAAPGLQRSFAVLVLAVAVFLMVKNYAAIL